jgi:hypothetical protein
MSLQREVLRTEGFDLWDGNSEIRTGLVAFQIGAVAALLVFSWKAFLLAMVLWWVAGGLGVGYPDPGAKAVAVWLRAASEALFAR